MTLLLPQENVTAIKKQCQTFFSRDQIFSGRNLSTNWETVLLQQLQLCNLEKPLVLLFLTTINKNGHSCNSDKPSYKDNFPNVILWHVFFSLLKPGGLLDINILLYALFFNKYQENRLKAEWVYFSTKTQPQIVLILFLFEIYTICFASRATHI